VALADEQRLAAAARFQHAVAAAQQNAFGQGAHGVLIFDEQHRLALAARGRSLRHRLDVQRDLVGHRQVDAERRPLALDGIHADRAAGLPDHSVDDGQSEARALALLLGRKERVEGMLQHI